VRAVAETRELESVSRGALSDWAVQLLTSHAIAVGRSVARGRPSGWLGPLDLAGQGCVIEALRELVQQLTKFRVERTL
jgi:hypothetical protein